MSEPIRQPRRIGVFLVDDHELFRRGVRALLDSEPDIEVIGEAETALALLSAIMAGAVGYVSKRTCGTDLVSAVRAVASGQSVLDSFASRLVMAELKERAASSDPVAALSDQEKRVLDLIGEGLTNRQIAERMFLAEKTVKNYVSSLLTKLGMQRRAQAAVFAARHADDRGTHEAH